MTNLAFFPGNFSDLADISFKRLMTGPHKSETKEIDLAKAAVSNFLDLASNPDADSIIVQNALRTATKSLQKIDSIDNHPYLDMAYNDYTRSLDQKHTDNRTDAPLQHIMSRIQVAKKLTESDLKQSDLEQFDNKLKDLSDKDAEDLTKHIDSFDDIHHLYDQEELTEETLEEHISRQERNRKRIRFSKSEKKRELKRDMALRKLSSTAILLSKARTLAIKILKEKMLHKNYGDMTVTDKERVEDIISKRKDAIARMVVKLVPRIRKIEQERLRRHVKEDIATLNEVVVVSPENMAKENKLSLNHELKSDTFDNIEEDQYAGYPDYKDLGQFKEMHAHMVHSKEFPHHGFKIYAHNQYGDNSTSIALVGSFNKDDSNTLQVNKVATNGKNINKVHELYSHMILHHGHKFVSDRVQSEGGMKIWKKLANTPGITVHGWDEQNDAPFDLKDPTLNDTNETHLRAKDLASDDATSQIHKYDRILLVAHKNTTK